MNANPMHNTLLHRIQSTPFDRRLHANYRGPSKIQLVVQVPIVSCHRGFFSGLLSCFASRNRGDSFQPRMNRKKRKAKEKMKPTPEELQDLKSKIVRVGNGDQQKWISVPNLRHIVEEPFPIKKKKVFLSCVYTLLC
jgi:hypothetical protein